MPAAAPTNGGVIEAALHQERAARERAEQSLQEAHATVRDLQTKLGHAELAQREASEIAQGARDAADALRAAHQEHEAHWREDLAAERAARAVAEAALAEAAGARKPAELSRQSVVAAVAAMQDAAAGPAKAPAKSAPKGTRKPTSTPQPREPQPVKWWLASAMILRRFGGHPEARFEAEVFDGEAGSRVAGVKAAVLHGGVQAPGC